MQLTKVQNNAVDQLIKKYRSGIKILDFKAPTGSGKTFMISHFIANLFHQHFGNKKIVVLLATLSSSQLPKQFANKVNQYMDYLPHRYQVEHKMSPSKQTKLPKDYTPTFFPENKKLIIVGRSSFTQSSIFVKEGVFDQFLAQVKHENYHLVYIRDEAHHGGLVKGERLTKKDQKFESRIQEAADFVLRMTATMNPANEQVVIERDDIVENDTQHLLKSTPLKNHNLKLLPSQVNNWEFLQLTIDQFKALKEEYKTLEKKDISINPAMLIQVDSETSKNKDTFKKDIDQIIRQLEINGLYWVKYFASHQKTSNLRQVPSLLELSKNDSTVDVVIFKIGPATGWDIPRACMLVQLRNVDSSTLNQQTLGRIMRNPIPNLRKEEVTDQYYLYSNYQKATRPMRHYRLKDSFQKLQWVKGVNMKKDHLVKWTKRYVREVSDYFDEYANIFIDGVTQLFRKDHLVYRPLDHIEEQTGVTVAVGGRAIDNAIALKVFLLGKKHEHEALLKPITYLVDLFCQKHHISPSDKFWYFLVDTQLNELNNLMQKENPETDYRVQKTGNLPLSYNIWEDTHNHHTVFFEGIKEVYAYTNSEKDQQHQQALDSKPENIFMQRIVNDIQDAYQDGEEWVKHIHVWTKNPNRVSQIYFEYLHQGKESKKLFLDFVFKIKEDAFLYVEVKSADHDYDPAKTQEIHTILQKYSQDQKNKSQIVFTIAQVNTQTKFIEYTNYSNVSTIDRHSRPVVVIKKIVNS